MGSAVDESTRLRADRDPHCNAAADLLPLQLEAAQERLTTRSEEIPLLRRRAERAVVSKGGRPRRPHSSAVRARRIGAELAARYGITDEGGRRPPSHRETFGAPWLPSPVVVR